MIIITLYLGIEYHNKYNQTIKKCIKYLVRSKDL